MKAILGFISNFFGEPAGVNKAKSAPVVSAKDNVEPIPVERMHEVPDFGKDQGRLLLRAADLFPNNVDLRIKWLQAIGKMRDNKIHWILGDVRSATELGKSKGTVQFDKWSSNNVAA